MRISVCMGIYNGETYLERQLESILGQTKAPREVILCDDCSRDGCFQAASKFIRDRRLEETWHLYRNEENLGYPGNFYHAMSLCTQELVFLADQDDIWDSRKLERMSRVFQEDSGVLVLACKFGLINGEGERIRTPMRPTKSGGTGKAERICLDRVLYKGQWPGMVLAYRRSWYESRKEEFGSAAGRVPHDLLLCVKAAEENGFYQLDEELAWHRRHENNTGGEEHRIRRLLNRDRKLREVQDYIQILEALEEGRVAKTEAGRESLARKRRIMQERYEALRAGSLKRVLKNAWKDRDAVRPATVLCDAVLTFGKRQ